MADRSAGWTAPSLGRHKPAILAVTAVALGCTIYYLHEQIWSRSLPTKGGLHRSDARRRPRRRTNTLAQNIRRHPAHPAYVENASWGTVPVSLDFLADDDANARTYGDHIFLSRTGHGITASLTRHMVPTFRLQAMITADPEEEELFREEVQMGFLRLYFLLHLPPSPVSWEQRDLIAADLRGGILGGFDPSNIAAVFQEHQGRLLEARIAQWDAIQDTRRENERARSPSLPSHIRAEALQRRGALAGAVTDVASEPSEGLNSKPDQDNEATNEGESLLNLLYRMMEDQAIQDGYVHRRVTCNSCGAMPIRGVRYRCTNCWDYDLCELCEGMQIHPKTHLFYKIRIPAPFLGQPRQPEPVQYPGSPKAPVHRISKESIKKLCGITEYKAHEIEALWEQFRCLAGSEWPDDPNGYNLAIDRKTFDKCFIPSTSIRPSPPNVVYDRIFSYYDQNNDGFIGFEEFLLGHVSFTQKDDAQRLMRLFEAYDSNNDGYVDRSDFLAMFKGYYAATKELTREVLMDMEDDAFDNGAEDIILGSQPISSCFTGSIPRGENSRSGQGKVQDAYGDLRIHDSMGAVDNRNHDIEDKGKNRGAFEIPETETDVGREVLYQVTEVALNELLDPIFKMREDLALAGRDTERARYQHRAEIITTVEHPLRLKRLLDNYQRRWRRDLDFSNTQRHGAYAADGLLEFLHQEAAGVENWEKCPRCAAAGEDRWIKLGKYCCKCLYPSLGRRPVISPMESCSSCGHDGLEGAIDSDDGRWICDKCGASSQWHLDEDVRLQAIISIPGSSGKTVSRKSLDILLQEAGYTAETTEPSRSASPLPDPTLPQNRPTLDNSPVVRTPLRYRPLDHENRELKESESMLDPGYATLEAERIALEQARPDKDTLRWYACLDFIQAEDRERGGPGRLNYEEWEEIMNGSKGESLGFLGSWIELASF